jgi:hypothetical protein
MSIGGMERGNPPGDAADHGNGNEHASTDHILHLVGHDPLARSLLAVSLYSTEQSDGSH